MTLFSPTILGNEWESKSWVACKPELKGNVENLSSNSGGRSRYILHWGSELGDVANHVGVSELMTAGLGQLVPNVEPISVVFVTNF